MKRNKKYISIIVGLVIALCICIISAIQLIVASPGPGAPNPGHSWNQMECDNNFCVNITTGRVGIGTTTPGVGHSNPEEVGLDVGNQIITGLKAPLDDTDAVPKSYVDAHAGNGFSVIEGRRSDTGNWVVLGDFYAQGYILSSGSSEVFFDTVGNYYYITYGSEGYGLVRKNGTIMGDYIYVWNPTTVDGRNILNTGSAATEYCNYCQGGKALYGTPGSIGVFPLNTCSRVGSGCVCSQVAGDDHGWFPIECANWVINGLRIR